MKKDNNIDELFREKLLNYGQEPPAYLLENILAGAAGARRKRKVIIWRVAGVAAALLLAFMAGWQVNYMNKANVKQPVVISQNSTSETKITEHGITEPENMLDNNQETQVTDNKPSVKTELDKNSEVVPPIRDQKVSVVPELLVNSRNKEFAFLLPLKNMNYLLSSNIQISNELHEMTLKSSSKYEDVRTIDQQIIEQNQQDLTAQNENQKNGHWLVGAQVSPAYSVNRGNHSAQYASNMLNSSLTSPVELGGGVSVEYKPGKRWSLQSGVYFAGLSQTSGNTYSSNSRDYLLANAGSSYFNTGVNIGADNKMSMNSNAGVIEFKSIPAGIVVGTNLEDKTMASAVVVSDARFTQNFQYIEIPIYLRYTLIDSKIGVELLGGLSSNVLVGNSTYVESSGGSSQVGKTKDMETMNYSGTMGFGIKYGLTNRFFLNVEPRVKYYLNSLNNNSDVSYRPYTIGVYTGISYQF